MSDRVKSMTSWVIAVVLCIAFVAAGSAKLASNPMMVANFHTFGYPLWFMGVTGALEIIGALLVIVPGTARVGAALLACIMLGAMATVLIHDLPKQLPAALFLFVLTIAFLYLRGGLVAPLFVHQPKAR